MPAYDFKCKKCGHVFWFCIGKNTNLNPPCPKCQSETKRLFPGGQHVVWAQGKPTP